MKRYNDLVQESVKRIHRFVGGVITPIHYSLDNVLKTIKNCGDIKGHFARKE